MGTKRLNAREASLAALLRVEEEGAFASLALAEVLPCVQDHRDRKLAAEITYGVITYKSTLDWLIEHTAGRPVDKLDRPVLDILRIGFYQLFFLDRIPPQAAVHATVELVKQGKKRALAPFVNGVLRGALRNKNKFPWPDREKDEVAYLALKYAHPPWLVRRWLSRLGPETELLLAANNRPAPFTVRVNSLKTSRKLLQAALTEQGLQPEPSSITAEGLVLKEPGRFTSKEAWKAGLFQVQGESAMLVSHVVDPRPGERVLDGCSAPGGKTTHLAELMKNSGEITALDIHPRRLALVEAACRRLGITIVNTVCLDMREASPGNCGMFDRVLLDVPCSGLGVIRRKPDLKWRCREGDIRELAAVQLAMLKAAAGVLKPGGVLVYSTCTNEPEETDETIAAFLSSRKDFLAGDERPFLPEAWQVIGHKPGVHLYPHIHGVDGFFICRLQKIRAGG